MALRPFYLPHEFPPISVTGVYIDPSADLKVAADTIRRIVQKLGSQSSDSVRLIMSDFNSCRLSKSLPNYLQYVTCKICRDQTIDLCYSNIPRAYRSYLLASLGRPVHNLVYLLPTYRQKLKPASLLQDKSRCDGRGS